MNEEEICTLTSAKQVRRLLDEMVTNGGYRFSRYENDFPVYIRKEEELTGVRVRDRKYQVVKRVRR